MTDEEGRRSDAKLERKPLVSTILISSAATVALLLIGSVAFIYSGVYDVAATSKHTGLVRWALSTLAARSIDARADDSDVPDIPNGPDLVRRGAAGFDAMCVRCHGAPGRQRNWLGKGLQPQGPDLADTARRRSPGEIYRAIKYGIKFTGMPALAPTHDEEEILALTAFVAALGDMSPERYRQLRTESSGAHSHDSSNPSHAEGQHAGQSGGNEGHHH